MALAEAKTVKSHKPQGAIKTTLFVQKSFKTSIHPKETINKNNNRQTDRHTHTHANKIFYCSRDNSQVTQNRFCRRTTLHG